MEESTCLNPRLSPWWILFKVTILMVLTLICGCREPNPTIRKVQWPIQNHQQKPLRFDDPWTALKNLDWNNPVLSASGPEQRQFAVILKRLLHDSFAQNLPDLENMAADSSNVEIQQDMMDILGENLFHQSQWKRFLKYAPFYGEDLRNDIVLANAFCSIEKESCFIPDTPVELPLRAGPTGAPIVDALINGEIVSCWLDTGTGLSVVASDTASRCGVEYLGREVTVATTGTRRTVDVRPAIIEKIELGNLVISRHPATVIDSSHLTFRFRRALGVVKIDAILGWKLIKRFSVQLDYESRVIRFKKTQKMVSSERNLFWLGYPFVKVRSTRGTPLYFGLDTGAESTTVTRNILKKHAISVPIQRKRVNVVSAGGSEKMETLIIPALKIIMDEWELSFHDLMSRPAKGAAFVELDGILGSDILRAGTLTIDWPNGVIGFDPHKQQSVK